MFSKRSAAMETDCLSARNMDTTLPLSCLRLLVPPLRLASAAMWHMTLRGEVKHFGKFEEFVTLFILELCRSGRATETQTIHAHLDRIRSLCASRNTTGRNVADALDGDFLELVQTLLKDPAEREHYFQEVFPVEFGPKYDSTLQTLMWEFLSRLENLLHVPDLTQTASLLSAAPAGVEECLQSASQQQQLKTLLLCRKCFKQFSSDPLSPSAGITSQQAESGSQSGSITVLSSSTFSREVEPECLIDSTDYSELEAELRRSVGFSEGAAVMEGEDEGKEQERNELESGNELTRAPHTFEESAVTCDKMESELLMTLKWLPESEGKINMIEPQSFTHENRSAGWTLGADACVFACAECRVFHSDEGSVHQHIQAAHPHQSKPETRGSRTHCCSICGKSFKSPSDRTRHERTHTGERPFHCAQCGKGFITAWDLTRHQRSHAGKLPFYCKQCGDSFKSSEELTQHRLTHPAKRRYSCRQCGKSFDSLLERSKHRQTHAVRRQYKCPQCEKSYTRPSDMRRHQRSHTGERPYRCALCAKTFRSSTGERKHQQTHTGERPFPCSYCGKRFTRLPILTRHERIHTGERPYLCSHCGKSFLSLGELSKHQKCHTDERPYLCAHCGKGFKREGALMKHRRSHTGERPYCCPHCQKTFTDRSGLNRHQLLHTGERPYCCPQCGKSFLSSGELLKHQRFHTGERPFSCSLCPKSFTQSCYLKRHERSHSGERPYSCPHCGKSFPCSAQLNRHTKTHSEEQPFLCSECGQSFSHSHLLKTHQLTHTVAQS
ncbi:hypothetical protein GJAV_G00271520 [Gymnothorax javanicus]|nr:hypothetical protein GJAV_G00271520 [Gymnothorax javanicus]